MRFALQTPGILVFVNADTERFFGRIEYQVPGIEY